MRRGKSHSPKGERTLPDDDELHGGIKKRALSLPRVLIHNGAKKGEKSFIGRGALT